MKLPSNIEIAKNTFHVKVQHEMSTRSLNYNAALHYAYIQAVQDGSLDIAKELLNHVQIDLDPKLIEEILTTHMIQV